MDIDLDKIKKDLERRMPGQSEITTQRKEPEEIEVLSGIVDGKTLGSPIAVLVYNKDQRSKDYDHITTSYRPSHADFTYDKKYGTRDARGGGRSSARETVARVIAGSIAKQLLEREGVSIQAYVSQVGDLKVTKPYTELDLKKSENMVRCPDEELAERMIEAIKQVKKAGDTLGGTVTCVIKNCPVGLGEPVFDKLHADLGKAMLSINAVKGFEYGSGFSGASMKGSKHNDVFTRDGDKIITKTNYSGGVQGGISNGQHIYFKVAFKPVSTIMRDQHSIDSEGNEIIVKGKGRHDPCVVPRAVPIVEAMAALVLADHWLRNKTIT